MTAAFLCCSESEFKQVQRQHFNNSTTVEVESFSTLAVRKGFINGQSAVVSPDVEAIVYHTETERLLAEAKLVMATRKAIAKSNVPNQQPTGEEKKDQTGRNNEDDSDDEDEIEEILSSVQFFTVTEFLDLPMVLSFKGRFVLFNTTGFGSVTTKNLTQIKEQLASVGCAEVLQGLSLAATPGLTADKLIVVFSDQTTLILARTKLQRFIEASFSNEEAGDSNTSSIEAMLDSVVFVGEEDFVFSLSRALESAEQDAALADTEGQDGCFDDEEEEAHEDDDQEGEDANDDGDDMPTGAAAGQSTKAAPGGDQWEVDAEAMLEQYVDALLTDTKDATHWYNLGLALEQVAADRKEEAARRQQQEHNEHDEAPAVHIDADGLGDVTEADCYVKAVQYDPKLSDAWYNLGRVLMSMNEPSSLAGADDGDDGDDSVPTAAVTIPGIDAAVGEVECFRRAVETTRMDDGQCWCNLGDALFRHKVYDGVEVKGKVVAAKYNAQQCALHALKKDSTNFVAWNNLGDTLFEKQQLCRSSSSSSSNAETCTYEQSVVVNGRTVSSAQECYVKSLSFEDSVADIWKNLKKTMDAAGSAVKIGGTSFTVAAVDKKIRELE